MAEMVTQTHAKARNNSPAVIRMLPDAGKFSSQLCEELLRAGKSLRLSATGNSMDPLVRSGDQLLIKPVDPHKVAIGDVVFFTNKGGQCLLHRVIRRHNSPDGLRFLLHSDNAVKADGWISSNDIIGRLHQLDREGTILKMGHFGMRCLSRWMVINLRYRLNRFNHLRLQNLTIKQLPGLSKYLT